MRYGWLDFEPDAHDKIPGKYILTIFSMNEHEEMEDEIAVIVHRTCEGRFPLDGEIANAKRVNAQRIVDALNGEIV